MDYKEMLVVFRHHHTKSLGNRQGFFSILRAYKAAVL